MGGEKKRIKKWKKEPQKRYDLPIANKCVWQNINSERPQRKTPMCPSQVTASVLNLGSNSISSFMNRKKEEGCALSHELPQENLALARSMGSGEAMLWLGAVLHEAVVRNVCYFWLSWFPFAPKVFLALLMAVAPVDFLLIAGEIREWTVQQMHPGLRGTAFLKCEYWETIAPLLASYSPI